MNSYPVTTTVSLTGFARLMRTLFPDRPPATFAAHIAATKFHPDSVNTLRDILAEKVPVRYVTRELDEDGRLKLWFDDDMAMIEFRLTYADELGE